MKYNTIYAFGENNESGIRSRQVPVWRGFISIVLSVINSGPNNYYGIDEIPVCKGSGMYRLHCINYLRKTVKVVRDIDHVKSNMGAHSDQNKCPDTIVLQIVRLPVGFLCPN